jgi:hypothetical protein
VQGVRFTLSPTLSMLLSLLSTLHKPKFALETSKTFNSFHPPIPLNNSSQTSHDAHTLTIIVITTPTAPSIPPPHKNLPPQKPIPEITCPPKVLPANPALSHTSFFSAGTRSWALRRSHTNESPHTATINGWY